jgi:iron(III) transport system ATP-binding protein
MLKIKALRKTYDMARGKVHALKGVDFDVAEGEFFTLLGPSGSGKSTVLRCVAGLEFPQAGEIFIGDECVYSSERKIQVPPDERPIGMVFQSYAIWPHMDVFNNVAFPLLYGTRGPRPPREEIRKAVAEALRVAQMSGYEDRPATQLSGGQQQRVALARALVRRPKLLLLDEPLSNLDAKLREEMRVEVKEITRAMGITAFFVTHDQVEALVMSDRIGVIMEGGLVEVGSPYAMYTHTRDKRVANFLGTTNNLEGQLQRVGHAAVVATEIGPLAVELDDAGLASGSATVSVRPEAIECSREKPADATNVFEGVFKRVSFLGSFVEGELQLGARALKVVLNPYSTFAAGERAYVRLPRERLQVVR